MIRCCYWVLFWVLFGLKFWWVGCLAWFACDYLFDFWVVLFVWLIVALVVVRSMLTCVLLVVLWVCLLAARSGCWIVLTIFCFVDYCSL